MIDEKRKAVHKKLIDLKAFREKVARYRRSPEDVEEFIHDEIPRFASIIDPLILGEVPPAPRLDALFTSVKNEKEYRPLQPAPHEAGLFLLPYTDSFRARFIETLQEEIEPLQDMMRTLRDLERLYLKAEKECRNSEAEQGKEKKKEPIVNRYKRDYDFFKLLITLTIDNNQLGELLSEVGRLATEGSILPGGLVDAFEVAKECGKASEALTRSLHQYGRMASLCENLYVCSIASWASLSNYISMKVRAIERKLVSPEDASCFRPEFIRFQGILSSLIHGLNGCPTEMQKKALFYAYLSFDFFLRRRRHPKDPFRLGNFAQVGAGKTYTTPIFLKMFSFLISEAKNRGGAPAPRIVSLYFTEANLTENVYQSMIDMGISRGSVHVCKMRELHSLSLKPGDCVILSRHEFALKEKAEIIYPLDVLIRRGFSFMVVADESSFLKNSDSGISIVMDLLYNHLRKRHALWIDYRLSATPTNNDTGDFIYLLNTNRVNMASFLHHYPMIAEEMSRILRNYMQEASAPNPVSLDRLLTLLKNGGGRTGVLLFTKIVDEEEGRGKTAVARTRRVRSLYYTDCAGAVLALYYFAVYRLGLFQIPLKADDEKGIGLHDILDYLGVGSFQVSQPATEPVQVITGLGQPIMHPGSRRLSCLMPCLLFMKEMASALTYDRALNADGDIHFQINAKQLRSNLLESVTTLEVLEKIRQFLNLVMFSHLVRKVRANPVGWWLLRRDIEAEFARLRMEFAAAYAGIRGLPVVHEQEEVRRKVHQGFCVIDKTEYIHYLAIEPSRKGELIGLLQEQSDEGVLGPKLFDDLAQYFTPVRFFELLESLELRSEKMTLREKDLLREDIDKKRADILEILGGVLGLSGRLENTKDLLRSFTGDLKGLKPEKDGLLHFRPSILFRYPSFLQTVHEAIRGAIGGRTEDDQRELRRLLSDIGSDQIDSAQTLASYSIIFQASESLNFPLVLRFSDQVLGRLATLLGEKGIRLRVGPGDVERLRKVIAHAASFENFSQGMGDLARRHHVPVLISCHYRVSQGSVSAATNAEFAITGDVKKEERYRILGSFDKLDEDMGRVLVVTTRSILKGFNIFHTQYGFMSEGMNNAEERVQMAGRLRPLYSQHIRDIDRWIQTLEKCSPDAPVLRHLRHLKDQVKVFDVVAPEMLRGFPDIQAGKAMMLNTFLFQQIHQRSFPELFSDEDVLHYVDSEPLFNSKTVERFCERSVEESMEWLKGKVEGGGELAVAELIRLLEAEILARAEENVSISSYFSILQSAAL